MPSRPDHYRYQPLSSSTSSLGRYVRILTLYPGTRGSQISCDIAEFNLNQLPAYEALSYTWGNPNATRKVRLGGLLHHVTINLEIALQELRHADELRVMWVDALCIDQSNLSERSEQVQLMGEIYAGAVEVLIWLGEGTPFTELAFCTIEEICRAAKVLIWRYCSTKLKVSAEALTNAMVLSFIRENAGDGTLWLDKMNNYGKAFNEVSIALAVMETNYHILSSASKPPSTIARTLERYLSSTEGDTTSIEDFRERVTALSQTFRRGWWTRVWIIQEVVFARSAVLVTSSRRLPFACLEFAVLCLLSEDLFNVSLDIIQGLLQSTTAAGSLCLLRMKPSESLLGLLGLFWNSKSTDPRDKIYALLNLDKYSGIQMVPDYMRTEVDVFVEATKAIISEAELLDIIAFTRLSSNRQSLGFKGMLPSWVPNYWEPRELAQLVQLVPEPRYKASLGSPIQKDIFDHENLTALNLRGLVFDKVEKTFPRVLSGEINVAGLRAWMPDTSVRYPTGEMAIDAFWRTLLADSYQDRRVEVEERDILRKLFIYLLGDPDDTPKGQVEETYPYTIDEFKYYMADEVSGRVFCETRRSYIGMALGDARSGDIVCVIYGTSVPLILRHHEGPLTAEDAARKTFKCTIIGPVYIHGIMDGEVMQTIQNGKFREEVFHIV